MSVIRCITKISPVFIEGCVVHGYKRGSTLLNCPTANVCTDQIQDKIHHFKMGVYFGWAKLKGETFKMIANIGKNPSFGNDKVSVEVHLLHQFEEDFYDENLQVVIVGSIRTETKFASLEELKITIHEDCKIAEELLNEEQYLSFREYEEFS